MDAQDQVGACHLIGRTPLGGTARQARSVARVFFQSPAKYLSSCRKTSSLCAIAEGAGSLSFSNLSLSAVYCSTFVCQVVQLAAEAGYRIVGSVSTVKCSYVNLSLHSQISSLRASIRSGGRDNVLDISRPSRIWENSQPWLEYGGVPIQDREVGEVSDGRKRYEVRLVVPYTGILQRNNTH